MTTQSFSVRRFCYRHSRSIVLLLSTGIVQQGLQLLMVLVIGGFFELMFQQAGGRVVWMHSLGISVTNMQHYMGLFTALLMLRWITDMAVRRQTAAIEERWSAQLREALFAAQVLHYPEQFHSRHSSRYLLRYGQDVKSAQQLISKCWIDGFRQILVVSSGLLFMWWLYPPFGSIATLCMLAAGGLFIGFSVYTRKALLNSRHKQSALHAFASKQFRQFHALQVSGKAAHATLRFNKKSQALLAAKNQQRRQEAILQATAASLPATLLLLLFYMAWQQGGVSYANAMMLVLLIMQWQSPIRKLLRIPAIMQKGNVSLHKMRSQWPINQRSHTPKLTKQSSLRIASANESPKKYVPSG